MLCKSIVFPVRGAATINPRFKFSIKDVRSLKNVGELMALIGKKAA